MEGIKEIKKLFEPVKIGSMILKNRAVYAPMIVGMGGVNGEVTRNLIEYYVETAKAGMGLLTVEATSIAPGQRGLADQLDIWKNEHVPGLSDLVRAIHTYVPDPPKLSLQLVAWGRETEPEVSGTEVVAPSPLKSALHPIFPYTRKTMKYRRGVPRELTLEEVIDLEDAFAEAAARAQFAGFDAVEFHAAHGYMIAQFLSPFTNKRDDIYGQDRTLFLTNIIKKTRSLVGSDFPIIVRFSGSEFLPGGATVEERQDLARHLESLGVSAISVSGGVYETGYYIIQPMMIPRGCHIENAAKIKNAVNIPVYAAGRINDPRIAEKVLLEGKLDLVAFGRPFIADREFLIKAREGRFDEIRKCIACNHCIDTLFSQRRIECTVNPAVADPLKGEQSFYEASKRPAAKSKKVVVVGGGPGGMECAKIASMRGHEVILFEKEDVLGGNLIPAAAVSFKEEINRLLEYQRNQIKQSEVKVELGVQADANEILGIKPDVVVLATGSIPILPEIPGIDKYREKVATAVEVLQEKATLGKKVVVVGGGMIGCEAAVWLVEKGHDVTLVTRRSAEFALGQGLAADWGALSRLWLLTVKWPSLGIQVVDLAQYNEITEEGLITVNRKWEQTLIPADSIVFSLGFRPNDKLFNEIKEKVDSTYLIGDCKRPRKIIHAIREGTVSAQLI